MRIILLLVAIMLHVAGGAEARYSPGLEIAENENITLDGGFLVDAKLGESLDYVTVGPNTRNDFVTDGTDDAVQVLEAFTYAEANQIGEVRLVVGNCNWGDYKLVIPPYVTFRCAAPAIQSGVDDPPWDGEFLHSAQVGRINVTSETNTPLLLSSGSVIDGIAFNYPNQEINATPTAYPATIGALNGTYGAEIRNVNFGNCYIGYDDGGNWTSKFRRSNIAGAPIYRGIVETNCYDVSRTTECHWNPCYAPSFYGTILLAWIRDNAIGYYFEKSDASSVTNCFAWGYNIGLKTYENSGLSITKCSMDACRTPYQIIGSSYVSLTDSWAYSANPLNGAGWWYDADGIYVENSVGCSINSNRVYSGGNGIRFMGTVGDSNTGVANDIYVYNGNTSAQACGIYISNTNTTVLGNVIKGASNSVGVGMRFNAAYASGAIAMGNVVQKGAYGIYIDPTPVGAIIQGNAIRDAATPYTNNGCTKCLTSSGNNTIT